MPSLQFKGKSFVQNYHLAVPFHELIPIKEKSLSDKPSLTDNLIIHGDNLKALKSLLPLYAGKVKCIYIDPPYNTGNENWKYNDNVNSPMMQEWLGREVDKEDLTRHDKWLCMMAPRLKLLRELLREDGVIFISVDDNEQHHLRDLMDEIFGEEKFITCIVWQRKRGRDNSAKFFSKSHEYVLCYGRNEQATTLTKLEILEETKTAYKNPDNDPRGAYRLLGAWARGTQGGSKYSFKSKTGKNFPERLWLFSEKNLKELDEDNRLVFVEDKVYRKLFLNEHTGSVPETIWTDASNVANAADEMKLIFGSQVFETPKPVPFVKKILQISTNKDDIILDSFSGSGTTGHATLAINKEDGGNRKFILVETEVYADKITAERVRRVIKGVKGSSDQDLKSGLKGSFTFCELGDPIDEQRLLVSKTLPKYEELARYVFYVSTGEEFKPAAVDKKTGFIGESSQYHVYLFYEPNTEALRHLALDRDKADAMKPLKGGKKRLVFAPAKYLDQDYLDQYLIDFAQLPYEIYQRAK